MTFIGEADSSVATFGEVTYTSTGDGSTIDFTLPEAPIADGAIDVWVGGVSQSYDAYITTGTTLRFSEAPADGALVYVKFRGRAQSVDVISVDAVTETHFKKDISVDKLAGGTPGYIIKYQDGVATEVPILSLSDSSDRENIISNSFQISVGSGATVHSMIDGVTDEFSDFSGISKNNSLNESWEPDYQIEYSGYFNGSTAYFTRTPTAGNLRAWTLSLWVKFNEPTGYQRFVGTTATGGWIQYSSLTTTGSLEFFDVNQTYGGTPVFDSANIAWRDPNAWHHVLISWDPDGAGEMSEWVDGVLQEAWAVPASTNSTINSNIIHYFGRQDGGTPYYFEGFLADIIFVDGQVLTPSSFGKFHPQRSVWLPKTYTGTFGTNGYHLDFASLGIDVSGNGNDWTNNAVTQTQDTPTNLNSGTASNFVAWSNIERYSGQLDLGSLSNENKTYTRTGDNSGRRASFGASGGKVNIPFKLNTVGNRTHLYFVSKDANPDVYAQGWGTTRGNSFGLSINSSSVVHHENGVSQGIIGVGGATNGDVWAFELDFINDTVDVIKNGVLFVNLYTSADGQLAKADEWIPLVGGSSAAPYNVTTLQSDYTDWEYSPSNSEFKALSTWNRDGASGRLDHHFKTVGYVGDGVAIGSGGKEISGVGFQPDVVWIKNRDSILSHHFYDSIRGAQNNLVPDLDSAQATQTEGLASFNADGFTVGSLNIVNNSGNDLVAWCLNLPNDEVNTSGTISANVKKNTTLGVSIGTFTGTGVNATIGHGLDSAPFMIIVKKTSGIGSWQIYHSGVASDPATDFLSLDTTAAVADDNTIWNDTAPTSTVFSIGTSVTVNESAASYIFIAFSETAFCKKVVYTGSGSGDGTFTSLNGTMQFMLWKGITAGPPWNIFDSVRSPFNPAQHQIQASAAAAEATGTAYHVDFMRTTMKPRTTDSSINGALSYVGVAFVDQPTPAGTYFTNEDGTNMILFSEAFTVGASPASGYTVFSHQAIDSLIVNTDIKAWISRDGGRTVTTDFATDDKIDLTANSLNNGDRVSFTSSGTLPTGLSNQALYYIVNAATNDFEVSLTLGGATVALTDNGTGVHNVTLWSQATLQNDGLGYEDTGNSILSGSADLTNQPSGTTMRYLIETLNNKKQKVFAAALQWD